MTYEVRKAISSLKEFCDCSYERQMDYSLRWFYTEVPLVDWFKENYRTIGFDEIIEECSDRYDHMKVLLAYEGRPDFIVRKGKQWLALEVEKFLSDYGTHAKFKHHSDIVLCYSTRGGGASPSVIGLQEIGRLNEIQFFPIHCKHSTSGYIDANRAFAQDMRVL